MFQLDVKNTFLNGDIEEQAYMFLSTGYNEIGKSYKLKGSIWS